MIPRVVYLGEDVTATSYFLDANSNAVKPINSTLYPVYRVLDPVNELVAGGVGSYVEQTRCYSTNFSIPITSVISTDNNYSIEWILKDTFEQDHFFRETFEVAHPSFSVADAKEQQKICLPFTTLSLNLPLQGSVDNIILEIYDTNNGVIFSGTPQNMGIYDTTYIYTIDIPPNVLVERNVYMAVWTITNSTVSSYTQVIRCINLWELQRLSDLRMYLDKVAKPLDLYTGYRDSDLYFYLLTGADYINSVGVPTQWSLDTWQTNYSLKDSYYWLLEGAKYVGLRSQYLAEGDSAFNFSSQPLTLDVDRTQFIESELGRITEGLTGQMLAWKKNLTRRMKSVGHLNVTVPSVNNWNLFTDRRNIGFPLPHLLNAVRFTR